MGKGNKSFMEPNSSTHHSKHHRAKTKKSSRKITFDMEELSDPQKKFNFYFKPYNLMEESHDAHMKFDSSEEQHHTLRLYG